MSWRGQGGKRAKGRRGDQEPELDNTAWLAELEREATAQADDDDEDDWASTLRGRRPAVPPAPNLPSAPGYQVTDPDDAGYDPGAYGSGGWAADPGAHDPSVPDPDWSWRPTDGDAFGETGQADPDPGWERYRGVPRPEPAPEELGDPQRDATAGAGWNGSHGDASGWSDPGSAAGPRDEGAYRPAADPRDEDFGGRDGTGDPGGGWQAAGVDTPTGAWDAVEPVGREPDYPALFGELYRRSAAQQDPIWEAPPAAEPLPDQGQTDPPSAAWPFEETTQSWEPSDRSFVWPPDELPSTQAEWDQPGSTSWLDDPPPAAPPEPDHTTAWPGPGPSVWEEPAPEPAPEPRPSPWASQPGTGNGVAPPPPPVAPAGPPPDDWAAAIPTDVPAARRAADPSATHVWRPDEAAEAEPGVPLGPRSSRAAGARSRRPAGGAATGGPAGDATGAPAARARPAPRPGRAASQAAGEPAAARRMAPIDTGKARRNRQGGERQARAWPRVVAVIAWIVLLMVLCWYYVFPWLERVLPENF